MEDKFDPRPFQANLQNVLAARVVGNETATVAYVAPGSGKTLAWQAAITDLIRTAHVSTAAVFVPRTNLAIAAETDYRAEGDHGDVGDFMLFEPAPKGRLERVLHRRNAYPLLPHGARNSAYVTCYASLVSYPDLHLNWAREHEGDFLLVVDEAQFCGEDIDGFGAPGGTRAAEYIKQISLLARHTLLLTGTYRRADGRKLAIADYKPHPDNPDREILDAHVEATYADGVSHGYLRDFEVDFKNCSVSLQNREDPGDKFEARLSDKRLYAYMGSIKKALRREDVWKPLVDEVVDRLQKTQRVKAGHRALIACMEQMDARKVIAYLAVRYPDLRVEIAVSQDGAEALNALRRFKGNKNANPDERPPADVLVTVRMAFIGYDCKQISVIGILTNYRDHGHLTQLVGRGLRVWAAARGQLVQIVTTDDPKMVEFIAYLRDEADKGLAEREERERGEGDADSKSRPPWDVDGVGPMTSRIENRGGTIPASAGDRVAEALRTVGPVTTATQVMDLIQQLGFAFPDDPTVPPVPAPVSHVPKTEAEIVTVTKAEAAKAIGYLLRRRGHDTSDGNYQKVRAQVTRRINDDFDIVSSNSITTKENARAYLKHVRQWVRDHDV